MRFPRRAPEFWREKGVAAKLLSPLGALYGAGAGRRLLRPGPRPALPAIVVGGLTVGGDGKTPLVMALASLLEAAGERPALLTRGYGRRGGPRIPFAVDSDTRAEEAGDEALLLARRALTIVGADRAAGAELAREKGATVVVCDDGFQSRALAPDLALLVIDSDYGAGNGFCLPAGPLRAPLAAQLAAADALVLAGRGDAGAALAARAAKPLFRAEIMARRPLPEGVENTRVVAFAGVGRPEKFFRTLKELGVEVAAVRGFPDHHALTAAEMNELTDLARRHGARLVTTEKDALRLSPGALDCAALAVDLRIAEPRPLETLLAAALRAARINRAS